MGEMRGKVIIWLRCHGIILRRRYFVGRGRRPRRPLKNIKIPIAFGGVLFRAIRGTSEVCAVPLHLIETFGVVYIKNRFKVFEVRERVIGRGSETFFKKFRSLSLIKII